MNLKQIFRFEFLYQARHVRTWLYFAIVFVAAWRLVATSGGDAEGHALATSPYDIAIDTVVCNLLWVLLASAVAGLPSSSNSPCLPSEPRR